MRVIGSLADQGTGDTTAPTVPQNVSATPINKNQVDISWDESTDDIGVSGYQVFRDGAPIETVNHPATAYSDTGLTPNTSYDYTIAAFDAAGNTSAASSPATAMTPANSPPVWTTIPGQDLIVNQAYNLDLSVYASDADVNDTLTYSVVSGTLATGTALVVNEITGTPTVAGESSTITVRADDGTDFTDTSFAMATFTADVTAPPVPTGLASSAQTTSTIDLSWNASVDVQGGVNEFVSGTQSYRLYRDSGLVATIVGTTYQDTGLSNATQYSYQISALDVAGNESALSSAVLVSTQSADNFEQDFLSRVAGSLYATNFTDVYLAGVKDTGRSGIATTQNLIDESHSTPGGDQLEWSTTQKLSGNGSLRMWINSGDAGGNNASWVFKCNGDRGGLIGSGVEYQRQYFQFSIYLPMQTLAWRTPGDSSEKIWKAHNDTFDDGELLIVNQRSSGFPAMQANNPTNGINVRVDAAQNGILFGEVLLYQPFAAQDASESFDFTGIATGQEIIETYGPLGDRGGGADDLFGQYGGDYTYINGQERLDQRSDIIANGGFPNAWANIRGQAFVPDGWTTITCFTDFNNPGGARVMLWVHEYGQQPQLVMDDTGTLQAPSSGDYGHMHQITYQKTSQTTEAGRPELSRFYDEIIVSENHISAPNPGGVPFALPNNPDGATQKTNLEALMDSLGSGETTVYTGAGTIPDTKEGLAWQTQFFYDEVSEIMDVFTKSAGNNDDWEHFQCDLRAETWTDKSSNGPNSPVNWNTTGHIYDHLTIDPGTRDLYLLYGNAGNIGRYNRATDDWDDIARGSWSTTSQKNGMAFHPNLYGTGDGGLVVGTGASIWLWRKSTTTWTQLTGYGAAGLKEGAGMYHPVLDAVFLKGRSGALFRIDAGSGGSAATPVNLGSPPIDTAGLGSGQTSGTLLPHPDGTTKIILIENFTNSQDRWWVSSDAGASWPLQGTDHGLHNFQGGTVDGAGGPFQVMFGGIVKVSAIETRLWKPPS